MNRLFLLVVVTLFLSVLAAEAETGREYILVSGGPSLMEWEKYKASPHDIWWGNFIRAARVRIQELQKENGPNVPITWLVYRPGYTRRSQRQDISDDLIANIISVRDKYKINLVWFDTTDQLLNYINFGRPRDRVKIANFEFYGHSNRACFMFDYSNEIDSASKVWLHEDDLRKIKRGIFTKDAFIKSWGCHTGESMSKYWKRATGRPMIGAIGKTDYSPGFIPVLSSKDARWTK
jgi:hypothetical protein